MEDNFLEITESNLNLLLTSILSKFTIENKINTSDSIFTDTNIDEWIIKKTTTRGGSIVINHIIKNPINNLSKLIERQKSNFEISKFKLDIIKKTRDFVCKHNRVPLPNEIDTQVKIIKVNPYEFIKISKLTNYFKHFKIFFKSWTN